VAREQIYLQMEINSLDITKRESQKDLVNTNGKMEVYIWGNLKKV
jgi:hypothetical protein